MTMRSSRAVRVEVSAAARELHARGWVANHDGNVSARDGSILVATPTATSKRKVTDANLVECDRAGKPLGSGKVFGEIGLHTAIYDRRPDIGAVVHAHPPSATAIACSATNLIERPFIAEAVVSLGPIVPRVAFGAPGAAAVAALAPWCELVDAAMLANHGVIAWGADVEQALMRLELVEHLARIALAAAPLGGPVALPARHGRRALRGACQGGLGRAADRAVEIAAKFAGGITTVPSSARPVAACAPAPHASVPVIAIGRRPEPTDLAAIVRDEVVRALRGT